MRFNFTKYLIFLITFAFNLSPAQDVSFPPDEEKIRFREVWAYVMYGSERNLKGTEPFTDICWFSAGINYKGRLSGTFKPPVLSNPPDQTSNSCRRHIVISELSSAPLMHFCLNSQYGVRDNLIRDIVRASADFDGVQIDFEAVSSGDADAFHNFLKILKQQIEGKMLSVAVPARASRVKDAYGYREIGKIADRLMIMAYDQHWSTSPPGPVASLTWCSNIAVYAASNLPKEKIIIGLPLYGRSWQDKNFNRAMTLKDIRNIMTNREIAGIHDESLGFHLKYTEMIKISVFYEDIPSIIRKLKLYREYTGSVAFWRFGFENPDVWNLIGTEKPVE